MSLTEYKHGALGYELPHDITSYQKLNAMIAHLENGKDLPPILVIGDTALSGSHRLVAWAVCEMKPDVIEVENEEYDAAVEHVGNDHDLEETLT